MNPTPSLSGHQVRTRLLITLMLNLVITVAEFLGGLISGSLSLISDALHNFSDGMAVLISYFAWQLARRPRNTQYTFGLKRAQILAAMVNAMVLVIISLYLFREAYLRLQSPQPIQASWMIIVAGLGLIANGIGTWLLHRTRGENMNLRSAYLHLLSDAVSSVGVILGGLAIWLWHLPWVDPVLTVLISAYILKESYAILKEALKIVLMATPGHLSVERIQQDLLAIPDVENVHHVHLWQLDENQIHFEAHVEVPDRRISASLPLLDQIRSRLQRHYQIDHVTIQFECNACGEKDLIRP